MSAPIPVISTMRLGAADGVGYITANLTADPAQWNPTWVTLSTSYIQVSPPGFVLGVPGELAGTPNTNRGSYANGQRAQFWAVEAAALVTAGAAAYS
jgi:hypothetical protein